MQLTKEQVDIINAPENNIKIIAGAGAAKTTTLLEFTKVRPHKRFLYIAFNKSVKDEATRKFNAKHVTVKTAHGLAHSNFVRKRKIKVCNELSEKDLIAVFKNYEKAKGFYAFIYLLKKAFETYCHKPDNRLLSCEEIGSENEKLCKNINLSIKILVSKIMNREIRCPHDAYLKLYMLTKPVLDFDYILFDEGQDASPVMLKIFLSQNGKKIIVGDPNQAIYRFRNAVNALDKVDFKTYPLTYSFRFGQTIALRANKILEYKRNMRMDVGVKIVGAGGKTKNSEVVVLCRSNMGVLEAILENSKSKIYLEGGKSGYNFSASGLLSDLYKLKKNRHGLIKSDLIRSFDTFNDAKLFAQKNNDVKIMSCIDILNKYGGNIFKEIKKAKERVVDDRKDANLIISTIHKAKGMEYMTVRLASEIKTPQELIKSYADSDKTIESYKILEEELNLLYVAVTRAIMHVV